MARSLKNMKRGPEGSAQRKENAEPTARPTEAQRAAVSELVNEYGGKSEAELMSELFRVTAEQKRDGSFDAGAMRRTAESIMPMLTPQQREKLASIIAALGE